MRMPLVLRSIEKYVCVLERGWRERYSRSVESSVCRYVEMIIWLWKYYSSDSSVESVVYEGEVSPLLCEVLEYVSSDESRLGVRVCKEVEKCSSMDAYVQLLYVLPKESWCECGVSIELEEISESVLEESYSVSDSGLLCNYEWAFTEYFWECVPKLKKIEIETLEKWEKVSKIYRNAVGSVCR